MATIVYSIAYVEIKLQSQDADLPIFRSICLVSGIIAIELLVSIITSPFGYSWLIYVQSCLWGYWVIPTDEFLSVSTT